MQPSYNMQVVQKRSRDAVAEDRREAHCAAAGDEESNRYRTEFFR